MASGKPGAVQLTIHIDRQGLAAILAGGNPKSDDHAQPLAAVDRLASAPDIFLRADAALTRRRQSVRMIYGEASSGKADRELEALLREAFTLRSDLLAGRDDSIEAMASRLGLPKGHIPARLRLTWLSPKIVKAILRGQHPVHLTRSKLLSMSQDLPLLWSRQRDYLGFPAD